MAKELLVNVSRGEEVRVALVEDGRLEEIYLERDSAASNVGNIYLGKVTNVEGSIQAAFVDFGYGRNGFLHVQDLHPDYFPEGGRWDRMQERVGKKIGRRDRPPIQDCLRRGDQIVVQIIKEGIGTKGPTLTSYPSIPGRFLVMMPGVAQMGVSKNIEDEEERRRLRKILDTLKPPKDVGFIIRTAGMGKTKTELERDFKYLTRLYEQIEHHKKNARPPTLLYSEGDLVTRTVRDVWSSDVDRVICDDPETALRIKQFFKLLMPRTKVDVQLYQGHVPLFHAAGVEQEIETMFSRHVPLPSGGSLVIDSTEAIVAIDVNSGKFREHDDAEETAFRTDMEAAEEICRQLRLRDLGGVVIVDFIDLRYSRHREALFNKLTDLFKQDKAKSRHLPMNEFGIVAITRQRMRPDLKKSVFMPCPWSGGTGYIKTPESMALDVMRRLRVAAADERVEGINVRLFPTVALHVLNTKRQALADLERLSQKIITLRQDETLAADDVVLELLDERGGQVLVDALQPAAAAKPDSGGRRRRRRRRRGGEEGGEGQPQAKGEREEGGLIELPNLLELGELKLEEVERLVDELQAGEKAVREATEKDPQRIILEALRSGMLFDEEPAATDGEVAPAKAAAEEETGEGRRRRRKRRGGREEPKAAAEPTVKKRVESRPPAEAGEEPAGEEEEAASPAETAGFVGAPGEAAQDHHEGAEREGGRRRRRRRRGGRDRDGHDAAGGNGQLTRAQPAPPADRLVASHLPDEILDRQINGNRADRETHVLQREPFGDGAQGQDGGRRGRRRRRGRGLRGQALPGQPATPGTGAAPERRFDASGTPARVESRPAPVTPPPQRTGEPAPSAQPGTPEEGGGRRRRRRRRRRGRGSEAGAIETTGAPMSVALEEPLGVSAEAELLEPDVSLELPDDELDLPSEGDATTEHQSLLAAEGDPNDDDSGPAADEPSEEAAAKPAGKKPTRRRPVKTGKKTAKKAAKSTRAGSKGSRPRKST